MKFNFNILQLLQVPAHVLQRDVACYKRTVERLMKCSKL